MAENEQGFVPQETTKEIQPPAESAKETRSPSKGELLHLFGQKREEFLAIRSELKATTDKLGPVIDAVANIARAQFLTSKTNGRTNEAGQRTLEDQYDAFKAEERQLVSDIEGLRTREAELQDEIERMADQIEANG